MQESLRQQWCVKRFLKAERPTAASSVAYEMEEMKTPPPPQNEWIQVVHPTEKETDDGWVQVSACSDA